MDLINIGNIPIGLAFLILGILNIAQSTAKRLWMQRYLGTLQSFVLIVWLRSRFGAYGVRYYYMVLGIGSSIGGIFLIFSTKWVESPIVLIVVMLLAFISAKYVLDWMIRSKTDKAKTS
jgi:hypothetical protein